MTSSQTYVVDKRSIGRDLALRVAYVLIVSLAFPRVAIAQQAPPATAQQESVKTKDYKVKAVFLYNFGRFTTWPRDNSGSPPQSSSFRIGVLGPSQITETLHKIAQKRKLHGQSILVTEYSSAEEVPKEGCEILFVSRSVVADEVAILFRRLELSPMLIVTESADHRIPGSVVNFVLEAHAVQFEVDLAEAQRKGLKLDARMLRQGKRMERTEPVSTSNTRRRYNRYK